VNGLEQRWIETETTINTVDWKGKSIQIPKVKALKDPKTGEIMVYPSEVAKAEIRQIAECLGICPRDVGTLIMILAKPGNFNEGDVFYKYHLQKMMFYLWKSLGKVYGDSLPLDQFIPAENGPIPQHLDEDLQRFEKDKLIRTRCEKWKDETNKVVTSRRIILTEEGTKVADELWRKLPDPYKEMTLSVKKRMYPLSPNKVRDLVHKEFPEYKISYIKNDIE
jgi:hypothetical protein